MDDAMVVRGLQGIGDLRADITRPRDRKRTLTEQLLECTTRGVLHNDVTQPIMGGTRVVDGEDIGVAECTCRHSLTTESGHELLVPGQGTGEDLDGHIAMEGGLVGFVHHSHPSLAQPFRDDVGTYFPADQWVQEGFSLKLCPGVGEVSP